MNTLQVVENNNMPQIKEWNGQRVVTFKDIDLVHGRKSGTARRNFNANKKHFIENEDYIRLSTYEIRTSKMMELSPRATKDVVFLTETGYLMIVKSFNDELSWAVQRNLVNNYFRAKGNNPSKQILEEIPKTWYSKNINRFDYLCEVFEWNRKGLFHRILKEISNFYEVEILEDVYTCNFGHPPKYRMQLVDAMQPLQTIVDAYLDYLTVLAEKEEQ